MTTQKRVARLARPKVNLTLEILGRREDGYHLLDSLVVFVAGGDRLRFEPADEITLQVCGDFSEELPPQKQNLVVHAAQALARLAGGEEQGASIFLEKVLPPAGGIGGGSADAAAALTGLMELWGLRPDPKALYELALSLGADVPVCLNGKPCFMRGIGEDLEAAPVLPAFALLLVNPGVTLETSVVFRQRSGEFTHASIWPERFDGLDHLVGILAERRNDLQETARRLQPVILTALYALGSLPGCRLARMSGSGATCFGLFASLTEAQAAEAQLARAYPHWWYLAAEAEK